MTMLHRPFPNKAGWISVCLAALALVLATRVSLGRVDHDEPQGRTDQARQLGLGGVYSNHTLRNDKGVRMKGWTFRFIKAGFSKNDIVGDWNDVGWTALPVTLEALTGFPLLSFDNSPNPMAIVDINAWAHFGYQVAAGVSIPASGDVVGRWLDVNGTTWSVTAATVHQYFTPAAATVTPSSTPTVTPTPTPSDESSATPVSTRMPLNLRGESGQSAVTLAPSDDKPIPLARRPERAAKVGDPPWIGLRITNTWEAEQLDESARTILVQRFTKIVQPPQEITLKELSADTELVDGAVRIDETPVMVPYGRSIEMKVGPLSDNANGVVVYYSARPATPPSGEQSNEPSYWSYLGIELTPRPGPAYTATPTPTPTLPPCLLPYVLRSYVQYTPTPTPTSALRSDR